MTDRADAMANLVTTAEVVNFYRTLDGSSKLPFLIAAASSAVENEADLVIVKTDITEYLDGNDRDTILLGQFPIETGSVVIRIDGVLIDATTYEVRDHGRVRRKNGARWPKNQEIKADYRAGYDVVPYDLKIAALILIGEFSSTISDMDRQVKQTGEGKGRVKTLEIDGYKEEYFAGSPSNAGSARDELPPAVKALIRPYKRIR